MKICVVGTGYVGLVTGTCFAEMGHKVCCVDADAAKVIQLQAGESTLSEPGLKDLVQANLQARRLRFTTELPEGLKDAAICFIAVGTPSLPDGSTDVSMVMAVATEIGRCLKQELIVVNKSTVPVGTTEQVAARVRQELVARGLEKLTVEVVSNPEFLKEGEAVEDFMKPDRIVIGADSPHAIEQMRELYEPFVRNQHPVLIMDVRSAEMTKYAANAMLALRISFMNEISVLCEKAGGDIAQVRSGIGSDLRIGMDFLNAGVGYGGSCFPKDVRELIHLGDKLGLPMEIVQAVDRVNERQKQQFADRVSAYFGEDLSGRKLAVWGLAFKPLTDDMREAPSLVVLRQLAAKGACFAAYDPQAVAQARRLFAADFPIQYSQDMMEALDGADALLLLTEWRQFRRPDFQEMKQRLKQAVIFDGRNQYNPRQLRQQGFEYFCIGRNQLENP